jgi:hypothetical protein
MFKKKQNIPKVLSIKEKMQERFDKYTKEFNNHILKGDKEFDILVYLDWETLAPSVLGLPEDSNLITIAKKREAFGNNEFLEVAKAMEEKIRKKLEDVFDRAEDYYWGSSTDGHYYRFWSKKRPNISNTLELIDVWEPNSKN